MSVPAARVVGAAAPAPPAGPRRADDDRGAARRVLVVADEALVSLDLGAALAALGYRVAGPAATLLDALRLAEACGPALAAAVVDLDLAGGAAFAAADGLAARGVPVVFASAGGDRAAAAVRSGRHADAPVAGKPISAAGLRAALGQLSNRAAAAT
jgi:CheY-like chemotaxis protein